MKFSPEHAAGRIAPQTTEVLTTLQERRNFNPEVYVKAKTTMLNNYMRESRLSSCVVAVSGGIDSALVLGLVAEAAKQPDSPIKNIYPLALPIYHDDFTKNQDEATARAREVCDVFGLDLKEIDLTDTYDAMKKAVDTAVGVTGEPWAAGQLVAYLRTPANYYTTSLTTQQGKNGIVIGTTNRDEGAYLGYVGKASDGIADVQLISDLHKSEVREVSKLLHVPDSILTAKPTGDMYDGRVDEEVFGASYAYVELFHLLKSLNPREAAAMLDVLDPTERATYEEAATNLEELHRYNAHKYNVGSPAVHVDVLESGVLGGWRHARQKVSRKPEGVEHFVNAFTLTEGVLEEIYGDIAQRPSKEVELLSLPKGEARVIHKAIGREVLDGLLADVDTHGWQPVGVDGIAKHYKPGDMIGSLRATTFSPELADYFWSRVAPELANPLIADEDPQVDIEPGSIWRPIGVSPLMRFIRYDTSGLLVPHYDAPFAYSETEMTLKSLVMYANATSIEGGATRFIDDNQIETPVVDRDMSDRAFARPEDVIEKVKADVGSILLFDHRILHDSEPVRATAADGRKVIVRTDVVYTKC